MSGSIKYIEHPLKMLVIHWIWNTDKIGDFKDILIF